MFRCDGIMNTEINCTLSINSWLLEMHWLSLFKFEFRLLMWTSFYFHSVFRTLLIVSDKNTHLNMMTVMMTVIVTSNKLFTVCSSACYDCKTPNRWRQRQPRSKSGSPINFGRWDCFCIRLM